MKKPKDFRKKDFHDALDSSLNSDLLTRWLRPRSIPRSHIRTLPMCVLYRSGAVNHTSTGNFQQVALETEELDTEGMGDVANNQIVIVTAGRYLVIGQATLDANATGLRAVQVQNNGVDIMRASWPGSAAGSTTCHVAKHVELAVGDELTLWGYQNSGGNLAYTVGNTRVFLSVALLDTVN